MANDHKEVKELLFSSIKDFLVLVAFIETKAWEETEAERENGHRPGVKHINLLSQVSYWAPQQRN